MTRPKIGFFIIRPEVEKSQVITIFLKPISDLRNNDEAPSVVSCPQSNYQQFKIQNHCEQLEVKT